MEFKKTMVAVLILFCCFFNTPAQKESQSNKITEAQWNSLFSALASENWKEAFDLSSKYLEQVGNDDKADSVANLRYMLIYSAAGSVSIGKMSYDNLEKQLPKVVGKKIATPFHPLGIDCHPPMFNYICKTSSGDYDVSITTANRQATSILAFEYINLSKKFDFSKHKEELAAVLGTVDKIVPNPNRSNLVILRIYTKDAEIVLQKEIDLRSKVASLPSRKHLLVKPQITL